MNSNPGPQGSPAEPPFVASTRKRRVNTLIFIFVASAILLYFVIYISKNYERLAGLFQISPLGVVGLCMMVVAGLLFLGVQNLLLYRRFSVFLSFREAVGLAVINTLGNLLPVTGGILIKGYYLRERHNLAYSHFFPSLLALYVCFIAVNGLVGFLGLSYWEFVENNAVPLWLYGAFLLMTAGIVALWFPVERIPLPRRIARRMTLLAEGWRLLGRSPSLLFQQSFVQLINMLLIAARFYIVFRMMSQNVSFTVCIIISAATILTRLVSVAPGGIGVREALVAGLSVVLGFDFGISVLVAGADRLVGIAVTGLVTPIFQVKKTAGGKVVK